MEKLKEAYDNILGVIANYKDIVVFDYSELERKANIHLFEVELQEKYGLDIKKGTAESLDYIRVDEYRFIGWYGQKYNRTVSWEDNNKQPEDELLLQLGFSTGAYIFGDFYPTELFAEFFQELKSFNPKYCDTTNKCLYFSLDNSKDVFNTFPEILKKYRDKSGEAYKKHKIDKLKSELEKLERN